MTTRLVVIGGDAAGMSAATNARRGNPELEIVALEKSDWTSYSACGIPYLAGGDVGELEDLVVRTPNEFRSQHRIDVRTGHEVRAIDLDRRRVEVRVVAQSRTFSLPFDELVLATGAEPWRPEIPGIDASWVLGVQTLTDAQRLLELGEGSRCHDVVVVGGGYIGLEMAEAFVQRGAKVTLVEGSDQVMGTLDPDLAEPVRAALEGKGVIVRTGVKVLGFEDDQRGAAPASGGVVVTDAGALRADLVVLGTGVRPRSQLAAAAGIGLGAKGAITVDRRQRTDTEGVWAAGDCATAYHRISQRRTHVALGTVANKMGRVAGINLGGGYATFAGIVGTAITKVCEVGIARTGLTEREAAEAGFVTVASTWSGTVRSGYMPDAGWVKVKLVAERGTGRLLGGQIVGTEGSAKRIDTVATALWAGLSVQDLIDADLAYAPPFSSVWDPVQRAARATARQLS
jgi:NADPH-dependent 2,4-dienoyl-CoA reductase/sulfur reductase-like enzyme